MCEGRSKGDEGENDTQRFLSKAFERAERFQKLRLLAGIMIEGKFLQPGKGEIGKELSNVSESLEGRLRVTSQVNRSRHDN